VAVSVALRAFSICLPGTLLGAPAAMDQTLDPTALSADITPQPLAEALAAFARQTGLQLIYESDLARHRTSGAASAGMSAKDALLHILQDTGLEFEYLTPHSIRILARMPATLASTSAAPVRGQSQRLEEVIVTAERRAERALDVADSLSVISASEIDRLHMTNLMDLAAAAPGLVIVSGGSPGEAAIVLRGFSPLGSQSLVTTVIDDSPVGASTAWSGDSGVALDMFPYDLERVEVLRGPQGTLYGANSMGGVLKYVTKDPSLTVSQAEVGVEGYGIKDGGSLGVAARGAWSAPLIEDTLAVRGSLYDQQTPGYIKNPARGLNHENALSQRGGRLAILWRVTADFRIKLQGIYQRIHSEGNATIFAELLGNTQDPYFHFRPGKWLYGDLVYPHSVPEPFTGELKFVCAALDWHMAFANLVSVTTFSEKRIAQDQDYSNNTGYLQPSLDPNTTSTLGRNRFREPVKRASQEIRLDSPSGQRLEWLAGLYYSYEWPTLYQYIDALDSQLRTIPALTPFFQGRFPTSYAEAAAFGTLTYWITDRLDLTAGLRRLTNRQRVETDIVPNHLIPASDSVVHSAETRSTYAFGAGFHLQPEMMVYLRVASGYRPGTPNFPVPGYPEIVPLAHSDTMVNYELGLKSELLNRKSTLDLTVFKINWSDMQIDTYTPDQRVTYTVNAGKATSEGLELAATQRLGDALHLAVNAAYTDAFATRAVPAAGFFVGTRFGSSPKWTAAVMLDYRMRGLDGWMPRLNATWRYLSAQYTGVSTQPYMGLIPAYSWVNLELSVTKGRCDLSLYAKNLLDRRAFNIGQTGISFTTGATYFSGPPIQPRIVGMSATMTF